MPVSTISSAGLTASGVTSASLDSNAQYYGFKNRIINGAMVIDQRNAGAAVTGISSGTNYITDRFTLVELTDAVFTAQQDTSAPSGFVNSLKITTTTADASIGSTQYVFVVQRIEGTNTSDFGWGASGASTVTLSFWVRSSLTGTFSGALSNSAFNYSYAFEYSISAADTWEKKTITISGPTAGTWLTTNGIGLQVIWSLGHGSNLDGTVNTWESAGDLGTSGSVAVASTLNATWYITGVQLEKGSTATSFDYRPYGTEFQLCQRYYEQWNVSSATYVGNAFAYSPTGVRSVLQFQVPKRSATTTTFSGSLNFSNTGKNATVTSFSFDGNSVNSVLLYNDSQTGFTTGQGLQMQVPGGSSATLTFSAEL